METTDVPEGWNGSHPLVVVKLVGDTKLRISGVIVFGNSAGADVRFFVADSTDIIQWHHNRGEFYELEELGIISEFFPRGGSYADIGAHIGNHIIYVSKLLHPSQIVAIEPNPAAIALLSINLSLNDLKHKIDCSHLGLGFSDKPGSAVPVTQNNNLGATRMVDSDSAEALKLIRGDDVFLHRKIDFIKMDVEGMEMRVLAGLDGTINRWRPAIFIEVDQYNSTEFARWTVKNDYMVAKKYRRYPHNENFMILPVERASP